MATVPLVASSRAGRLGPVLGGLLRPKLVVPAVALAVSAVELAIADRKYGVFTGGFGQSNAVDTAAERTLFLAAFGVSQLALVLIVWLACAWASRGPQRTALNFAFLFGGGMLFALVSRYQLHSYFSDAVDFALLRNLGGGSLKDALLFSKNEIALGVAALAALGAAWWLALRGLSGWLGPDSELAPVPPSWRLVILAGSAWLAVLAAVPRFGEDEARGLQRMLGWSTATQALAALTDFDRDGYGLVGLQVDRHPFDVSRHPLALDVPGNGIDEDGYGGDLELVPVPQARPETAVPAGGPHVVVVVMESTRGEVIGKRIDGRLVAPHLTALAATGGSAPSYSHVAFTTASLKSIFAGDLAPTTGAPSLFTELKQSGYRISVFSGQAEDFGGISATVGMREHADLFFDAERLREKRAFSFAAQGSLKVDEFVLLGEFERHFGKPAAWRRPQFVYLNFQAAHFPYDHTGVRHRFAHPPVARSQIDAAHQEEVERTYWNAVAHSDAALGALIARLKALGEWDDTVMLVTGDHGEALFEHGFLGHGHVIDRAQFATFLAVNRPLPRPSVPLAISDYRALLLDLVTGRPPSSPAFAPFMHIGELDRPSTIGLAATRYGIVTLRLDRGEACFERPAHCRRYDTLEGPEKAAVDAVVARWGSERWARRADV